ncbi:MAG TPA: RseA family anti-sigma factor [Steroidobacteraceae bacterium]|nr:RseA family anti-sigma factor [Steroidobacteraceae bacterium]
MKQDEVESQLSAMFDGELPSAECELLSRRIDRDDKLRGRWSRYALIGAAMRCEPVATARSDFASRVSRAVDGAVQTQALETQRRRRNRYVWQSALAASLVTAVAGLSLVMLRQVAYQSGMPAGRVTAGTAAGALILSTPVAQLHAPLAAAVLHPRIAATPVAASSVAPPGSTPLPVNAAREPYSYVTPAQDDSDPAALRTQLVDYIVAHSEYSTPLMRPDLLSALISGEDAADDAVHSTATAGDADAPTAAAAAGR